MPTLQVRVWAASAGVGVMEWTAETIRIWQDKGGLTTQWIDNEVRERIWEIAQSMSIINKQGARPGKWDLLIDRCVTRISDLECKRLLWKWYMANKTNLDGQKLKVALDEFTEVGLRGRENRLKETPTRMRKLIHVGKYFIAPMLHLLFLMMYSFRRRRRRNLGLQVIAVRGASRSVSNRSKFPGCFRFRMHLKPNCGNGSYHTNIQAHWKWASFTTKNPAFQHHNFASN